MKITIGGTDYVGLSMAVVLDQRHEVVALDILSAKVDMISLRQSPVLDEELQDYLANKPSNQRASLSKEEAYNGADLVIIPTPPITTLSPTTSTPRLGLGGDDHQVHHPGGLCGKSTPALQYAQPLRNNLYPVASWWAKTASVPAPLLAF